MSKERRLGRGLEALLGRGPQAMDGNRPPALATSESPQAAEAKPQAAEGVRMNTDKTEPIVIEQNNPAPMQMSPAIDEIAEKTPPAVNCCGTDLVQVNVALIEANPYQPRKNFDDESMAELAESISAHGLLQPIVARRVDDVYQLIAGERRLRAAQKAGWEEVPVRVIETDDRGAAELAIVENMQRKDLNPLEKAASFKRYLKEHRCTQGQLANRLKIDRSTIANLMRLLELPQEVQDAVTAGKISQGHARALLPLGEQREQVAFCKKIQNDGLSVRKTETLVQETIQKADAEPLSLIGRDGQASKQPRSSEHISALEQEFRTGLGTKVKLIQGAHGSGKLVIQFKNHEEFNRIKEHILGAEKPQAKAG